MSQGRRDVADKPAKKRTPKLQGFIVKRFRQTARSNTGRQDLVGLLLAVILTIFLGLKANFGPYRFFVVVFLGVTVASVDWLLREYWKIDSNLAGFCRFALQMFGIAGFRDYCYEAFSLPDRWSCVHICAPSWRDHDKDLGSPPKKKKQSKLTASMLVEGMRQSIEAFEADRLSIERLSGELRSRIAGLAAVADPEWAEELLSMRNQIEVVNAFYIESGRSALSDDERKEVNDVLGELKAALVPY